MPFEPGNEFAKKDESELSNSPAATRARRERAAKAEAEARQVEAELRRVEDAKADREFEKQHPRVYTPTPVEETEKIQAGTIVNRNPEIVSFRYRPDYELCDREDYEVMAVESQNVIVYTAWGRELKSRGVLEACAFTKTFPLDSVHLAPPEKQQPIEPKAVSASMAPPSPPAPRPTIPAQLHDVLTQLQALSKVNVVFPNFQRVRRFL